MKKIIAVVGLVMIWMLMFVMGIQRLDPDFGFHYRWGNDLIKNGWVWHDQYSYTIPDWPEVRHDWLTNVWMATMFNVGGMNLLAAVFAFLVVLTIWLAVKDRKWETTVIPIMLAVVTWLPRAGVRPQVQDWLLTVILLRWLETKKMIRWIPALFLVWVNLHGGFVMGLLLFGVWVGGECLERKQIWVTGILTWLGAALISGANPYGYRVWEEVWLTLSDGNLRKTIVEWLPFYYSIELGWWMMAGMLVSIGLYLRRYVSLWKAVICGGLFVAGLGSSRNTSIFATAGLIFLPELMEIFEVKIADTRLKLQRTAKIWGILVGFSSMLMLIVIAVNWPKHWNGQLGEGMFPIKAVEYLEKHPFQGNLFANYNWGGYLIWKYPEKKLFVDGRMPSWREGETWPFRDYLKIVSEKKLEPYFSRYDVKVVLWSKSEYRKSTFFGGKLEGWLKRMGVSYTKENNFINELEKNNWKKVYEDDVAVVYSKMMN